MSRRIYSIVPNLAAYLRTLEASITIIAGGLLEGDNRELVTLIDNGGVMRPWYDRQDVAVQLVARAFDRNQAERWASTLAGHLRGGYGGVVLPETTVGSETYPAITAWQFNPVGKPGYIGVDANRLQMWSANFTITIGG